MLAPAPRALADESGAPRVGRYAGAIADLETARWDGSGSVFSRRRTQRKTWVFLGAFSERFMVGFAVVDAGLLGTAFCYVFDRERKRLWEDKLNVPLGFPRAFRGQLAVEWALARGSRAFRLTPEGALLHAHYEHRGALEAQRFRLSMRVGPSRLGMSTIAPSSPARPFNHTFKDCDLECAVALEIEGAHHTFVTRGMLDFTLGYPPRRTFWNWAAGTGQAGAARVGFNLVAEFNAGLENALWVEGSVVPLGLARFEYDKQALEKPWRVYTEGGVLEASFEPDGRRAENIRALVLGSQFVQLFGRFQGRFTLNGRSRDFAAFGVVEEHLALW